MLLTRFLPSAAALALGLVSTQGSEWRTGSLEEALSAARAAGTPLAVFLESPQHAGCERLWRETLTRASVAAELAPLVRLRLSATSREGAELVGRMHVSTLPAVLFLTREGELSDALVGVLGEGEFLTRLCAIRSGVGTLDALRRAAAAAPDDLEARYALAMKLEALGWSAESRPLLDAIRSADPDGKTHAGARLRLAELMNTLMDTSQGDAYGADMGGRDLQPMYAFLKRAKHDDVLLEGWTWLAQAEATFGDPHRSLDAVAKARAHVAPGGVQDWSARVLPLFWDRRTGLAGGEKRQALALAEDAVAEVEAARKGAASGASVGASIDDVRAGAAYEALARFRWLAGRRDDARAAARRALELDPQGAAVRATLELVESAR